jgi:hypothetical protein
VLIFDNLSRPGAERNLRWLLDTRGDRVQVELADVRNPYALRRAVRHASHVFHFAAPVAVTTSLANPRHDFDVNALGTLNLLEALPLDDKAVAVRLVAELTDGRGCERVIEAAGEQATLDVASDLTAVRRRLVNAGYHQDPPRTVNLQLWNWRGIDVINAHERAPGRYVDGMTAAEAMVASGALEPAPLYTYGFDLERAADAFTSLEQRPERFLKAWIQTNA